VQLPADAHKRLRLSLRIVERLKDCPLTSMIIWKRERKNQII